MSAARARSVETTARWRERWIGLRNKLIADPCFQRWATASPLTRFVARRRARALFDLCAGFVYSQTLFACVQLRLFEILREGPRGLEALSPLLALSPDSTRRLLRAAASLKLVRELPGERYALADLGASMLGNASIAPFVEHHSLLYDDLRDPVALLRGETETRLSTFWAYSGDRPAGAGGDGGKDVSHADRSDDDFAGYSGLMSRTLALVGQDILDAYPLTGHECLLDVGGGEGAFLRAVADRAPHLALKLFDLPPVAARARRAVFPRAAKQIEITDGSFLSDPLPLGADLITLVRILHDHDDESLGALLRGAYAALPPGGTVLVAEPMAGTAGAEPIGDAYFNFYLLAMGRGRSRTSGELRGHLETAGFMAIREIPTRRPLLVRILVGWRV
jgi:demethylspheroidene O-methyltransferase